jgi:hypothetical protein
MSGVEDLLALVVVHFDEDGTIDYHVVGGAAVRMLIIDERAPNDRVYEWLPRAEPAALLKLIGDNPNIGSSADERHVAIAARFNAAQDGNRHLSLVSLPSDMEMER